MSLEDREWFQEERKKKDNEYWMPKNRYSNNKTNTNIPNRPNFQSSQNGSVVTCKCKQCKKNIQIRREKPALLSYSFKCPICGTNNTQITILSIILGILSILSILAKFLYT